MFWCTADIGWITGHSYVTVLAPSPTARPRCSTREPPMPRTLAGGGRSSRSTRCRSSTPHPTAIRSFMKIGRSVPAKFDLSSLRLLGSVGEPINPEAWMWYREVIGANKTPIVDTWWQTETGAIMVSALPGVNRDQAGSAQVPLPGISIDVVDESESRVGNGSGGPARDHRALAEHAARHLGRPRALSRDLLGEVRGPGLLLRRRRSAPRRRRRPLAARPRRRCH